jgi:mono/diheme cytochrome c family protein
MLVERCLKTIAVGCAALLMTAAAGCRNEMHDEARYEPLELTTFFPDSQSSRPLVSGTVARGQLRIDEEYYTGMPATGARAAGNAAATAQSVQQAKGTTSAGNQDAAHAGSAPGGSVGGAVAGSTTGGTSTGPASASTGAAVATAGVTAFPFHVTHQTIDRGHERYNIYCSPCHGRLGDGRGMIVQRGFQQPPSFHIDRLRQAPVGHFFDVITNGFGAMYSYASRIKPEDRWAIVAYIRALQLSQNATTNDLSVEDRQKLETLNR